MANYPFSFSSLSASEALLGLQGSWTLTSLETIRKALSSLPYQGYQKIIIHGGKLQNLDTSSAWLLVTMHHHLKKEGIAVEYREFSSAHHILLQRIQKLPPPVHTIPPKEKLWNNFFYYIGTKIISSGHYFYRMIAFFGQLCSVSVNTILHPANLRFVNFTYHLNEIGLKAVPIITLMAFLISIVLGYQSISQLKLLGAEIFTIDLVAISVLREMAVLITAIMVAGRSGSAFTAHIGVMQINEEVSALRAMGLDPFTILVLPRMIAIVVALPLLTFLADLVGLFGAFTVGFFMLDMSYVQFLERLQAAVNIQTFLIGLVKAPVFALLIGLVGCMRGLEVSGSAQNLGKLTTISVVQAIFLVIVADALFSVFFTMMGM